MERSPLSAESRALTAPVADGFGRPASDRGFSVMELMVVLAIFGLLLAVTMPAFKGFRESAALSDAARQISEQLSVARQKAIATGTTQEMRFIYNYGGTSDYHIWANNQANPAWRLPANIKYLWGAGTQNTFRMTSDGRCQDFGWIILENSKGKRDTISVRTSGMIFVY